MAAEVEIALLLFQKIRYEYPTFEKCNQEVQEGRQLSTYSTLVFVSILPIRNTVLHHPLLRATLWIWDYSRIEIVWNRTVPFANRTFIWGKLGLFYVRVGWRVIKRCAAWAVFFSSQRNLRLFTKAYVFLTRRCWDRKMLLVIILKESLLLAFSLRTSRTRCNRRFCICNNLSMVRKIHK